MSADASLVLALQSVHEEIDTHVTYMNTALRAGCGIYDPKVHVTANAMS